MSVSDSIYQALESPHAFRLLDILPGHDDDPIRCELSLQDLARRPEYYALSYEWGSDERRVSVAVNNQPMSIQRNLHNFLLLLRLKHSRRTVWVDSICINQDDNAEKARSILMMKEIYTAAQSVFVWLGAHAEGSAELFDFFYRRLPPSNNLIFDESLTQALNRLLHRTYWTRTWILQEVVLAQNIRIFCGDSDMPWMDVAPVAQALHTNNDAKAKSPFQGVYDLRRSGASLSLEAASVLSHQSQCKDKRDLIYGVLGLTNDEKSANLVIDYNCSMEELVLSLLVCYTGESPFDYYKELTKRPGTEHAQVLACAKSIVEQKQPGFSDSVASPRWIDHQVGLKFVISDVVGRGAPESYRDVNAPRVRQIWQRADGQLRQYLFEDSIFQFTSLYIWTKVVLQPGDWCWAKFDWPPWGYFLFERQSQSGDYTFRTIGYGIAWGAYGLDQSAMKPVLDAFISDDHPYFEDRTLTHPISRRERDGFKGQIPICIIELPISILEILKLAAFEGLVHTHFEERDYLL